MWMYVEKQSLGESWSKNEVISVDFNLRRLVALWKRGFARGVTHRKKVIWRAMWVQWCLYKSRHEEDRRPILEARRCPRAVRENVGLQAPGPQTSYLQNNERINVPCFKPPISWCFVEAARAHRVLLLLWLTLTAVLSTNRPHLQWSSVSMLPTTHTHTRTCTLRHLLFDTSKLNNIR